MISPTIEALGLSKFYGPFAAIQDVTFSIFAGEVVAFLGPNGAGKSTTMKILTGFLAPTAGTVRIAGYDVATQRLEAARRIGYLPENGPLYEDMTPRGLLQFLGEARGLSAPQVRARIEEVTSQCSILPVMEKPISKLSRGYRQRVGMAHVLLHEPDVLIMDEPTSGLDPNQTRQVRDVLRELGKTKTILLSTHVLQEVEAVAGRVLFIHEGRIIFDGTPSALLEHGASLDEAFYQLTSAAPEAVEGAPAPPALPCPRSPAEGT